MKNWDYKLPKNWKPKTNREWRWYLERRIQYGDVKGLSAARIQEYLPQLRIDPTVKSLFKHYFQTHGT